MLAAILGISGPSLSDAEAALFNDHPPAGVILFARNIEDPRQLARLVGQLRDVLPGHAVLLVDQEGGRVARLRPPHWRSHPSAAVLGALHRRRPTEGVRAAWLTGALIGLDCATAGFDVACAPVLDLRCIGAHDVVGDRAFCGEPARIAALAGAVADGLFAAGIQPVGKHVPGHGRARTDSHQVLPGIDAAEDVLETDLEPFRVLHHLPWMMTAHVRYDVWDPIHPATLSPIVIDRIIRTRIGFGNLLISDDLAMGALGGVPARRVQAALAAGCDLALHCSGQLEDNADILPACPPITDRARDGLRHAATRATAAREHLNAEALVA
jgi:beta-N-acetylhexosaminidase